MFLTTLADVCFWRETTSWPWRWLTMKSCHFTFWIIYWRVFFAIQKMAGRVPFLLHPNNYHPWPLHSSVELSAQLWALCQTVSDCGRLWQTVSLWQVRQSWNFLVSPFEAFTTIYALEEAVASTMTVKVGHCKRILVPCNQLFYSSYFNETLLSSPPKSSLSRHSFPFRGRWHPSPVATAFRSQEGNGTGSMRLSPRPMTATRLQHSLPAFMGMLH